MNSVEVIEVFLVCVIISIQLWVFVKTYKKIELFKKIVPKTEYLSVTNISVPISDFEMLTPKEILGKLTTYKHMKAENYGRYSGVDDLLDDDSENKTQIKVEMTEVNVIECITEVNYVYDNILFGVNNYLIRNRGASSDFNLIKDIVERNTNAVEEDINLSIGVPLYLGLMGTMLGIVIGLFNMPDLTAVMDSNLNNGISLLIGGVKIAMIASFTGLLLTIINSGWSFKSSRNELELRKSELYTFIQIELLPIINQGLASTLESLQRNLLNFNNNFTGQLNAFSSTVNSLSGIFDSSKEAIMAQKELLDSIDKTKVAEMTRYNVKVLQQLDVSVSQFEKFNYYLTNVNRFVENSQLIVGKTNELLERTDDFKSIANGIDNRLDQSQHLLEFLSEHFKNLDAHKEFTKNTVVDVGFAITDSFKELREHIQKSSETLKQFTIEELDLLKTTLSHGKTNLDNLQHLATLNKEVSKFKASSEEQNIRIKDQLEDMNEHLAYTASVLEKIESNTLSNRVKSLFSYIRRLFKS